MDKFATILGAVTMFLVFITVCALLIGLPVMWMVNYLFASSALYTVFGVYQLTFWKAFWLSVLAGTIFTKGSSGKKEK
jgi:hypothetical protein